MKRLPAYLGLVALGAACPGSAFQAASGNDAGDSGLADAASVDGTSVDGASGDGTAEAGACVSGKVCVAAAPSGWTGPVQFYYGAAAAPPCPSSTTAGFSGGTGLTAAPASCSACSCTGIASCPVDVRYYDSAPCTSAPCLDQPGITGACVTGAVSACTAHLVYQTIVAQPSSATCAPSQQSPVLPPTAWMDNAQECRLPPATDSCGAGRICTSTPTAPFRMCVYTSGDVACPSVGPYSAKQLIDTKVADARSCTGCSCELANGASCSAGSVTVFHPGEGCDGGSNTVAVPTTCAVAGGTSNSFEQNTSTATPSACTPGGGQPTGTATPASPVTVCCSP